MRTESSASESTQFDLNLPASGRSHESEARFRVARAEGSYFGPIRFRRQSQPYMTISVAESRPGRGVVVAQVDLRFVSEVISQTRVGSAGYAYAINSAGRLIAHRDINLVLKRTSLAGLPQVRTALDDGAPVAGSVTTGRDPDGTEVLSAYQTIDRTGWRVFVEEPLSEAFAPLNSTIQRTALLLALFLALAVGTSVVLARRMARPIEAMQAAAARIGAGALDQRIDIRSNDELGALAGEFNRMVERLEESYAGLEQKVEERTRELETALGELDEKSRELETASKHKSEFLANMSHELRTPLNAIIGFSQVLRERMVGEVNEKQQEYLEDILASGNHLLALIDDILDLSKVEAGQIELEVAAFSLDEALERGVVMVRERALQDGVQITLSRGSGRRRRRRRRAADPTGDLQPALERRQVHARGRRRRRQGDAGQRRGRGLGGRHRPRHRPRGSRKDLRGVPAERFGVEQGEGTGLGLALSKRLVELHGGRIWVDCETHQGEHVRVHAARGARVAVAGEQILVVEDNAKNMKLFRDVLQATGYRTLEATTGSRAIELAGTHAPDLVLMDIQLPDIDGVEALSRLRADVRTASIPVLALTAQAMRGDRERFLDAGFDDYVSKPVNVVELVATVGRHCVGNEVDDEPRRENPRRRRRPGEPALARGRPRAPRLRRCLGRRRSRRPGARSNPQTLISFSSTS